MPTISAYRAATDSPYVTLICAFLVWKALLLLVAVCSPGIGYDTSTDLLFEQINSSNSKLDTRKLFPKDSTWLRRAVSKLVRWDAIYFVSIAQRGPIYEQEWAFVGLGSAKLSNLVFKFLLSGLPIGVGQAASAILVANTSHLVSVYCLYLLCEILNLRRVFGVRSILVASLHIMAPAGIFLSAPYAESLFSALSFAGYAAYAKSKTARRSSGSNAYALLAAVLFGISCTVRSNGLFNGLLFVLDLKDVVASCLRYGVTVARLQSAIILVSVGSLMALGFAYPQYSAWVEYCKFSGGTVERRVWCDALIPSVYTFVQKHYWNVGFLRYWTLSNLPLFALALPVLTANTRAATLVLLATSRAGSKDAASDREHTTTLHVLRRMAVPQLILTGLALTNFHVQIITRISSAYPLTYVWIASILLRREVSGQVLSAKRIVLFMVMYALIQGSLFASFLPPA